MMLFRYLDAAIKCDPAHNLRIDEVSWLASYFPDATVSLVPMIADVVDYCAHHIPQWTFERLSMAFQAVLMLIEMDTIQYLAENVQLLLTGSSVANTNRARVAIAAEMGQLLLGQVTFTANAVHNLHVRTVRN